MKYLFILGRNPKLSVAEVFAYLEREDNELNDYKIIDNALLVDVSESIEGGAIDSFGGVISIGIVLASGSLDEITSILDNQDLYSGEKNKINYVIWDFSHDSYEDIKDYLKKRFKSEKLKATEKKLRERMDIQDSSSGEIVSSKNIDEQYFIFGDASGENYFGRIVQKCDYKEIEKRDMGKPVRREKLAISPRLAKIMINLSQVNPGEKLVDCFCGIGVVLQEALLQQVKVIGIDKDGKAVKNARENLKWFKFPEDNYELINEDSSKVEFGKVNVLVSEPDLGETLKKIPTKEKAKEQLRGFENLIINVLNNVKKNVSGRIVFTSPLIRTVGKRLGVNIDKILDKTGLKLVKGFPIDEYRKNQIVGRRIFVLEH